MFTDQPVTPTRVEVLLDIMRDFSDRKLTREILIDLVQPDGLPDSKPNKPQAKQTLSVCLELGLIEEDQDKRLRLTFKAGDPRSSRQILLSALDEKVLTNTRVEPYLGVFYSFVLSLNSEGTKSQNGDVWVRNFQEAVYGDERPTNPFNETKLTGLNRWYSYIGLGWYDTNKAFQANPYERILRRLKSIFAKDKKLMGELFMERLAHACPELDGGQLFLQSFRFRHHDATAKLCTLGLAHALIDLHLEKKIRLVCPLDSRGWSLELADPLSVEGFDSSRIDSIELL